MSRPILDTDLHAAYDWIASAGEWGEALAAPEKYAAEAAANWQQNRDAGGAEVTESDLLAAIEWHRRHEASAADSPESDGSTGPEGGFPGHSEDA